MIKVKDLKELFKVETSDRGKTLHLFDKKNGSGSRTVHKYLVTLKKVSTGIYIVSHGKTRQSSKLDDLLSNIEYKIKSYKYDSEYYDPRMRDGSFEELIVIDKLNEMGFQMNNRDNFILMEKSLYGDEKVIADISIYGLDSFENKQELKITLHIGEFKWVDSKPVKRDVEEILNSVKNLIGPLSLVNTLNGFEIVEKCGNFNVDDIKIKQMNTKTLTIEEKELKPILIEKLENALKQLKG